MTLLPIFTFLLLIFENSLIVQFSPIAVIKFFLKYVSSDFKALCNLKNSIRGLSTIQTPKFLQSLIFCAIFPVVIIIFTILGIYFRYSSESIKVQYGASIFEVTSPKVDTSCSFITSIFLLKYF